METKRKCTFFARRDDDKATVVVQCIGFGRHWLNCDAVPAGWSINLDGVVAVVPGFLPKIEGETVTFQLYVRIVDKVGIRGRKLREFFFEAETVVDKLVVDVSSVNKAGVFLEIPGREIVLVEDCKRCPGERQRKTVDFLAQGKVGVPSFGIRKFRFSGIQYARIDGDAFAREVYGRRGTVGERETGECAGPVAGEYCGATVAVAFVTVKTPFEILQETVQRMRSPAHVVDELVICAFPVELCKADSSRKRRKPTSGVRICRCLTERLFVTVTEKDI